jgi:DNA-binding response OmpR family regulator
MAMAQKKTILIVDDDDDLRALLAEQLEAEGFAVESAGTGAAGVEAASKTRPDLVLMDLDLPDFNGREASGKIRDAGLLAPIIMLTAADGEDDTIKGLEAGAGDYVTKPFKFAVLLARVRAQLRAHEQAEDATFTIGPYDFQPANKLLIDAKGKRLRLTDKEASILRFLYRAGDKAVSREVLLAEVWGYNAGVTTHTLETHVYRLRQKIEPDPAKAKLLVTEAGGYRLAP